MSAAQRQTGILTAVVLACVWLASSGPGYVDAPNFFSYLALLVLMLPLFLATFRSPWPGSLARYAAGFGVAQYGLNAANASILFDFTRRQIVWSTLGMVAALALYRWRPGWRKYGIYLLPVAAAACFHRATLAFAPLLFAVGWLSEKSGEWRAIPGVFLRCIPGLLVSLLAVLAVRTGAVIPGETPWAGHGSARAGRRGGGGAAPSNAGSRGRRGTACGSAGRWSGRAHHISPADGPYCLLAGLGLWRLLSLARGTLPKSDYRALVVLVAVGIGIAAARDYHTFRTLAGTRMEDFAVRFIRDVMQR